MVTGCCMHLRLGSQEDSDRHASLAKKKGAPRRAAGTWPRPSAAVEGQRARPSNSANALTSICSTLPNKHTAPQTRNPAKLATASRTKPVDSPLTDACPFVLFKRQFNNPNSDHAQNPNPEQQYKTAAPGEPELAASTNPNT